MKTYPVLSTCADNFASLSAARATVSQRSLTPPLSLFAAEPLNCLDGSRGISLRLRVVFCHPPLREPLRLGV